MRLLPPRTRPADSASLEPRRGRPGAAGLALLVLLAVAFVIRLDGITGPPFDNAVARQFHAAVLARVYYLGDAHDLSPRKRAVVAAWRDEEKPIEPPLMERLAAVAYHIAGHERLWLARVLSVLWWILGGALLYRIALRMQSPAAALATCAVFLFLPFAILASRSFQPDPLLAATILAALLALIRYDEHPTGRRLGVAGAALALAFLVKPGIAPPILFPLLVLLLLRARTRGELVRRAVAFALSTLPMFAWYAYGTIAHSFLRGHFSAKVSPALLVHESFWNGWWDQVVFVLTYPLKSGPLALLVLVGAAVGVAAAKGRRTRTLLVALWAGYILYGLVFTVHISTHNYYSLPLVAIVALSLGSLVDAAVRAANGPPAAITVLVTVAALLAAGAVSWKLHSPLTDSSFKAEQALYTAAGRAADHTSRALYVDTHYAEPERYFGWTAGTLLTSGYEKDPAALAGRGLAAALRSSPAPRCLIFTGAKLRAQLAKFEADVASRYTPQARTADFAVYDLTKAKSC